MKPANLIPACLKRGCNYGDLSDAEKAEVDAFLTPEKRRYLVSIDYNAIDLSIVDHLDELDYVETYDTEIQTETTVTAANEGLAIHAAIFQWELVYCLPDWFCADVYESITTKEL